MSGLKKVLKLVCKGVGALLLLLCMLFLVTSVSPIYDFQPAKPFSGADIFNPYADMDTTHCWKRANFHTHTRVDGLFNECPYWPDEVYRRLEKFGYEVVTFSNHNRLTQHPFDPALQVNLYEHGRNILKFHKLVFGSTRVLQFDHFCPFLTSQKQFQLDLLGRDADIIQVNHPLRTKLFPAKQFVWLSGYRLMELDSGRSTENAYWDSALTAGHYSFGLANDDLHFPDQSKRIAVRCNFLCTPSAHYEDLLQTLRRGAFYAMRVPDYGRGDWEEKYRMNRHLPAIETIGVQDQTIYATFSVPADSIRVIGAHHTTLAVAHQTASIDYTLQSDDPYARITAYFPQGEVIYTNPFARYDASVSDSPFCDSAHPINYPLTILFNLTLLVLLISTLWALYKLVSKR